MTNTPGPIPMSVILASESAENARALVNAAGHGPTDKPCGHDGVQGWIQPIVLGRHFNWPFLIFWSLYGALVASIVWKGVLWARKAGLV